MNQLAQTIILTGAAITAVYIIARAIRRGFGFSVRTVQETIAFKQRLDVTCQVVASELLPNGGGSLKDRVTNIEAHLGCGATCPDSSVVDSSQVATETV